MIVEHRLPGPCQRRLNLDRLLRHQPRSMHIVAALRFDIKSAQAQQLGIGTRAHGAESLFGGAAVAGHLRRLGRQQQSERFARRQPRRLVRGFARDAHVAGADRDQAARDRQIAFHGAAMPEEQRHLFGRTQDAANDRPDEHHNKDQRRDGERRDHQGRFRAVAHPRDDDVARPVGKPDEAYGDRRDRNQKKNDADHRGLTLRRANGLYRPPACAQR